jgi:hypothetical protein
VPHRVQFSRAVDSRETRYTIGPAAQREVLDSLLELNQQRYAAEVAQGLHEKRAKRAREALF